MAYIESSSYNTLISGTSNNDVIHISGQNVTVNSGAGDDSIKSDGYNNVIIGSA